MKQLNFLPGRLDKLILKALSLGSMHGYGVLLRSQQISKAGRAQLKEEMRDWNRMAEIIAGILNTASGEI